MMRNPSDHLDNPNLSFMIDNTSGGGISETTYPVKHGQKRVYLKKIFSGMEKFE